MTVSQPAMFTLQAFTDLGALAVGGRLYTYASGTTTHKTAYTDAAGTIPHTYTTLDAGVTQFIALDARGELPAPLYLTAGAYDIALKTSTGATVWTRRADPTGADLAGTGGAALIGYLPAGTGAVATTMQAKLRESISDSGYTTLQQAVTAATGKRLTVYGSWTVTAAVTIESNTEIVLAPGSVVTTSTADISVFSATSKTNIRIAGPGTISKTGTGTVSYVGLVLLESCTKCIVEGVNFAGMQWSGVLLSNSDYCTVRGNYFSGGLGTVQDSADVHVFRQSRFNIVDGNFCYGGGYVGVFVQDPGTSLIPSRNCVTNNRIGAHTAYGILQYNIDSSDAFTEISGNFIEGITGVAVSGNSGAGIYVVNSGGVSVIGNTIRNCCISTTGLTLTPAGIGLNSLAATLSPCVVSGNSITDIVNYFGIEVATSSAGVSIVGNTIRLSTSVSSNTIGVYINAASNCSVNGNTIIVATTANTTGITVHSNGVDTSNNTISNNNISGCGYAGIRVFQTGAFVNNNMNISGNVVSGGGVSCVPFLLATINDGTVTGNVGKADTTNTVSFTSNLRVVLAGNNFTTTGTKSFITSGICTGCYYDKSNYSGENYTFIQNTATGLIVEFLGNAVPLASNWAVGDRVEMSVPVVGQAKGWRCTVAGVPGTWVSEGNL